MQDRLQELLRLLQLSPAQFAEALGINRATVSHLLSGRNNPSVGLLQDLVTKFTDVNIEWLVTGSGVALKSLSKPEKREEAAFIRTDKIHEEPDPSPTLPPPHSEPNSSSPHTSSPILKVLVIRQDGSIEEYGPGNLHG